MQLDPITKSDKNREYLSFKLGEEDYAVEIMAVREIRSWSHADPLPHAPVYMRGMINLRGILLPVLDLSARLGMRPIDADRRSAVIVVQVNDQSLGLLVAEVSDILDISSEALQSPPEVADEGGAGYVSALAVIGERMVRILDLGRLLPAKEEYAA
jgi:purine-binding chemotaxis protein CheW